MGIFEFKVRRLAKQTQRLSKQRRKEETLAGLRESKEAQTKGLEAARSRGVSSTPSRSKAVGRKAWTGFRNYATALDKKHSKKKSSNPFDFKF